MPRTLLCTFWNHLLFDKHPSVTSEVQLYKLPVKLKKPWFNRSTTGELTLVYMCGVCIQAVFPYTLVTNSFLMSDYVTPRQVWRS